MADKKILYGYDGLYIVEVKKEAEALTPVQLAKLKEQGITEKPKPEDKEKA